jgi:transketolase
MGQIIDAIDKIPPITNPKPTVLIAHTIKGKGVSYMEHQINWHAGSLSKADTEKALADIEANYAKLGGGK